MMEKDEYNHYYEISKFYTVKPEALERIQETNLKNYQEVTEIFNAFYSGQWWSPTGEDFKKIPSYHGDRLKHHEWPWLGCFNSINVIVFDVCPGSPDKQILRVFHGLREASSVRDYRRLHEVGRWIIDPKTRGYESFDFPDTRNNPSQTFLPFLESDPDHGYSVGLGGYYGSVSVGCLEKCVFWFKRMVPGMKPVPEIKRLLREIIVHGGPGKPDPWGHWYYDIHIDTGFVMDLFIQGDLAELLWTKCPDLRDLFYSKESYKYSGLYSSISRYSRSVRIALRHGVVFKDSGELRMFVDLMKLLEGFGKDLGNPKYIGKSWKDTHDELSEAATRKKFREIQEQQRRDRARAAAEAESKAADLKDSLEAQDREYSERLGDKLKIRLQSDKFYAEPLQSVTEFLKIGSEMSFCIWSAGYWKNPDVLLFKVSSVSDRRRILEVSEVSLKSGKVLQSHGYKNHDTPEHGEILKFMGKIDL